MREPLENAILETAAAELIKNGLDDWEFVLVDEIESSDGWAGVCLHEHHLILGAKHVLLDTPVRNIRETILHEIAHALTPGEGHSRVWLDKLKGIGGSGIWVTNKGRVLEVAVD